MSWSENKQMQTRAIFETVFLYMQQKLLQVVLYYQDLNKSRDNGAVWHWN